MQKPLPPAAGFVQAVPDAGTYPPLPRDTLGRLRWAEEAPLRNAPAKHVLLLLAHRADTDGAAWPSTDSLSHWSGLSRRGAQLALRWLHQQGWLATFSRRGRSSLRYPKSPSESVCPGCHYRAPARLDICPSCGWVGDLVQRMGCAPHAPTCAPHARGCAPHAPIRITEEPKKKEAMKG